MLKQEAEVQIDQAVSNYVSTCTAWACNGSFAAGPRLLVPRWRDDKVARQARIACGG